jgi:hypothetical protein
VSDVTGAHDAARPERARASAYVHTTVPDGTVAGVIARALAAASADPTIVARVVAATAAADIAEQAAEDAVADSADALGLEPHPAEPAWTQLDALWGDEPALDGPVVVRSSGSRTGTPELAIPDTPGLEVEPSTQVEPAYEIAALPVPVDDGFGAAADDQEPVDGVGERAAVPGLTEAEVPLAVRRLARLGRGDLVELVDRLAQLDQLLGSLEEARRQAADASEHILLTRRWQEETVRTIQEERARMRQRQHALDELTARARAAVEAMKATYRTLPREVVELEIELQVLDRAGFITRRAPRPPR